MQKNFPRNEVKIVVSSEIAAYLDDKFADFDEYCKMAEAEMEAEMEAEQDRYWNDPSNYPFQDDPYEDDMSYYDIEPYDPYEFDDIHYHDDWI